MGNRAAKDEEKKVNDDAIVLKIVPPLDRSYTRWLARDLARIHGFNLKKQSALKPPDHYIEYMQMNGWLDLDLDDPDLAHLFK